MGRKGRGWPQRSLASAPGGLMVAAAPASKPRAAFTKLPTLDGSQETEYETPGTGLAIPYAALVGTVTIEDSETGPAAPDGVTFAGVWRTITATGALTKPARVRIYWPDADADGVVDGAGLVGTALRMYRQRSDGTWEALTGQTADPTEAWVEATTTGFSVFALGTGTPRTTAATTTGEAAGGGGGGGCAAQARAAGALVLLVGLPLLLRPRRRCRA